MPKKNQVYLRSDQRNKLFDIIKTGHRSAREILYAHVLLQSAQGWTDAQIAEAFDVSRDTVRRIRLRFSQAGLKAALHERPRSGTPSTLTAEQETTWIALACSQPPQGYQRWTVRLLAEEAVKRGLVPGLAAETLRQLLKKTPSSLGHSKVGVGVTSLPNSWHA